MKIEDKVKKVDETFVDLKSFVDQGKYEYAAMLIRTIVEIIVNSYTDYYTPAIKANGEVPDLLTQINELKKCSNFTHEQIYNLHAMRKMSNKGSHQGTEETVSAIEIKGIIPTVETVINEWKVFAAEGHESLREITRQKQEAYLNRTVDKDPKKVRMTLVISILGLGAILYLTCKQTIQFLTMGLYYETSGLLIYWICVVAFFIMAAYLRHYGKVHKILFNIFALYFGVPRLYQILLCFMGNGGLGEAIIYILMAVVILGGYSILALHVGQQKGGIVGYK
jgi:hypothetical protein